MINPNTNPRLKLKRLKTELNFWLRAIDKFILYLLKSQSGEDGVSFVHPDLISTYRPDKRFPVDRFVDSLYSIEHMFCYVNGQFRYS